MRKRLAWLYEGSISAAWAFLILLLPASSLPLVANLTHADSVAAGSAVPLVWLAVAWFLPYVFSRGKLPRITVGALLFATVAVISSAAAFYLEIPSFKDTSILRRELQAVLTLAAGLGFYFVFASWPNSVSRLRFTMRLINYSGVILIVWSLLQAYFWFTTHAFPEFLSDIQRVFSINGFFDNRVTGFAFEPSWLAHQLNMVYLPIWLASTLKGYTAHRYRLWKISVENVLLVFGLAVLFLSSSRIGMLAMLLVAAYLVFRGSVSLAGRIQRAIFGQTTGTWLARTAVITGLLIGFFSIFFLGAYGLGKTAGRFDYRIARLFEPSTYFNSDPMMIVNKLMFAERVVFWGAGWGVFNDHPFLGVGLGNAGYFFNEEMPTFGWVLTEVNTVMYRATAIPNTKSLWTRILSETGLVGFAVWLSWLFVIWQATRFLRKSTQQTLATIGLTGILMLVALCAEGFSVDSFALPYMWFTFGLVSAASQVMISTLAPEKSGSAQAVPVDRDRPGGKA